MTAVSPSHHQPEMVVRYTSARNASEEFSRIIQIPGNSIEYPKIFMIIKVIFRINLEGLLYQKSVYNNFLLQAFLII